MFGIMPRKSNEVSYNNHNLFNTIENFFNDDFFSDSFFNMPSLIQDGMFESSGFKMDVKENERSYTVEAELPGINKEDIALDFNNGYLYIAVNHQDDFNDERDHYIHKERRSFQMQRSLYLGDIDVGNINANLDNGILRIEAPKLNVVSNSYRIDVK